MKGSSATIAAFAFGAWAAQAAGALGTAFTYQGQLKVDGVPANGPTDLVFRLFDAGAGGAQVGTDVVRIGVSVVNGLFTVNLDFGAASFTSEARWLEVVVDGSPLTPRQAITAAPYALHAMNAPTNWVDAGDNVFLPEGNVGVGTNEPTAMLHLHRPYDSTAIRFQSLRFDQGAPSSLVRGLGSAANSGIGVNRNDPAAALATNDVWATADLSEIVGSPDADQTAFLDLSVAGFSIPTGGQVTGVTVQTEGHATASCADCESAEVRFSAELLGGDTPSQPRSFQFGPSDTVVATGGSVDTWGVDWTPAQINNAGFGVRLSAELVVGKSLCLPFGGCGILPCDCTGTGTGFIDAVTITVFYFDAPTTSSPVHWSIGAAQEDPNFRIAPTSDLSTPAMVIAPFGSVGIGSADFLNGFYKFIVNGIAAKPNGGQWASLSDARVKKNVEPLSGALGRLLSLRGVTFEFNEEGLQTGLALPGRHMGFIAQEVEPVFPEWVGQAGNGYKVLSEYGTTALLVEALRELRAEKDAQIAELRERLAALERSRVGRAPASEP